MSKKSADEYSDKETKERFDAMLKGALKSPPKPLKSIKAKKSRTQTKKGLK